MVSFKVGLESKVSTRRKCPVCRMCKVKIVSYTKRLLLLFYLHKKNMICWPKSLQTNLFHVGETAINFCKQPTSQRLGSNLSVCVKNYIDFYALNVSKCK